MKANCSKVGRGREVREEAVVNQETTDRSRCDARRGKQEGGRPGQWARPSRGSSSGQGSEERHLVWGAGKGSWTIALA